MQLRTRSERTKQSRLMLHERPPMQHFRPPQVEHPRHALHSLRQQALHITHILRTVRRREVLAAAMRGAGVAGSLSVMLRYDAATPLVETQAQASMLPCNHSRDVSASANP